MYKLLPLFFLLIFLTSAFTTPGRLSSGSKSGLKVREDTSKVLLRKFDLAKMEYSNRAEFNYSDHAPANQTLFEKLQMWFWRAFRRVFSSSYAGGLLKYLAIAAAVVLLSYFVIKASGLDIWFLVAKSKSVEVPYVEHEDNIHEINFIAEIDRAVADGNYRLAVRLYYLLVLKKLDDKHIISWLPEKTNGTYVSEIKDHNLRTAFNQLTVQFEYVWYGEFFIDKENFKDIKSGFDRFNSMQS